MNEKNNNLNENNIDIIQIEELEIKNTDPEKYKLQCMLPDYIFNKLTEQEQLEFEQAVTKYPDLEEEVNDAKSLFDHIEKFDYKKMMYDKSQYLPDRVVANLERRNALHKPWKQNWKRLIGFGIFAAIILVYFHFTQKDDMQVANILPLQDDIEFFSDAEIEMFADMQEINLEDININPQFLDDILINTETEFMDFDDYYFTAINNAITETIQADGTISSTLDDDYMYILEELNSVDEEFFQTLLNQISNL